MDKNKSKQEVLLVDAGNSAVKWKSSTGLEQSNLLRKCYPENVSESFFIELWKDNVQPDAVLVSFVANEPVWQAIEKACLQMWDIEAERILSPKHWHGLTNGYAETSQLGSDRWCALVGAYQLAAAEFIVIDCGTAITIDVVNPSGQHLGGYILPGIEMMQQNLGMHTAQIRVEQKQKELSSLAPGTLTSACVQAGAYLAAVKAIESACKEQQKEWRKLECYLTGGDAESIAALLSVKYVMIPDLVLRGLASIAEGQKTEKQ